MPEQITPLSVLYLQLHGAGTAVCVVLFLYLLLCRGKAIAPDITPPARLRRWAAALFGIMALVHVWWILFYIYSDDSRSVIYGLLIAMDCMTLPPVFVGTLLNMLQDRRRPLWPIAVVMTPCAVLAVLQTVLPDIDLTTPNMVYGLVIAVAFIIYMVVAVRQYGRWLRDNYADLEHKEVWFTCMLSLVFILLLIFYAIVGINTTLICILHVIELVLFGLLLWRVETLPTLEDLPEEAASGELAKERLSDDDPSEKAAEAVDVPKSPSANPINIDVDQMEQLLKEHCVAAQLYLETELTLQMLAQAVGTNRSYLSQYFSRQGITYNTYINNLRVNHFISRSRELAAAGQDVPIQQLALESGFGSYRNFSRAFLLRTGQSVTAWINRGGNI